MNHDLQWTCTNEDMHALELALDPQPADIIVAIVGGGEQVFSLAEHLDTGSVLGIDINPYQIAQGYLKQALLSCGREEYLSFLNGRRRKQLWEKLQHALPAKYRGYGERVCAFPLGKIDTLLFLQDIYKRIPWLADDEHFAGVAQHAQKVSFKQQDITDALCTLPSESVDKLYLSNVALRDFSCGQDIYRVIRQGGRVYSLHVAGLLLLHLLAARNVKRLCDIEEAITKNSKGLEYTCQSLHHVFIGIKVNI